MSKIVRIEQGTVPVTPSDVRVMLQVFRVSDAPRIEDLVKLARDAREEKGWEEYNDLMPVPGTQGVDR